MLLWADASRPPAAPASPCERCRGTAELGAAAEAQGAWPWRGRWSFVLEFLWSPSEAFKAVTASGSVLSGLSGLTGRTEADTERARLVGFPASGLCPGEWAGWSDPSKVGEDDIPSEVDSLPLFSGLGPTPAAVHTHYMHHGF